jgi:hypothetical protein
MSMSKHAQEAVKKAPVPFVKDCRPEMAEDASCCVSQIGVLLWVVELGRVEVSMLALQRACPRDGHLEAVCRIHACFSNKHNSRMDFDPTRAKIDMSSFKECGWSEFHGDAKEPMPPNMPEPLGEEVEICLHVDSDHAGNQLFRQFRAAGFFVFLNSAATADVVVNAAADRGNLSVQS